MNTIQGLRAGLSSMSQETQRSFLTDKRDVYTALSRLLIGQGRLAEAEQVLALLKDQELQELTPRSDAVRPTADLVGRERQAADQQAALTSEGVALSRELQALVKIPVGARSPQQQARVEALRAQPKAWDARFQQWVSELVQTLVADAGAQAGERSRLLGGGTRLQGLIRRDPGAVGLHYVLGEETLSVIVSTAGGSFGRTMAIDRKALNGRIAAMRQALQDPRRDANDSSRRRVRCSIPVR